MGGVDGHCRAKRRGEERDDSRSLIPAGWMVIVEQGKEKTDYALLH